MFKSQSQFRRLLWAFIAFNLFVIMWGTLVRATHAGAGCGNHWPSCNGQVVPLNPSTETLIEFTHRVTSGLDGIFGLLLLVWGIRAFPVQTKVRWGMVAVVAFLVLEGAIGALLVRLDLVAQNTSLARGWVQGLHLVNTFLLLGALTLTQGWAHGWQARSSWWREPAARSHLLWVCLLLFVGAFGAITALGDTLFPASSFRNGLLQDFDPRSHPFLQMRVWHPVLAIITAIGMAYWAAAHLSGRLRWQVWLALLGQLLFGALNVVLLAPIWLQLLHHLLADITFITWIWAGVVFFGQSRADHIAQKSVEIKN